VSTPTTGTMTFDPTGTLQSITPTGGVLTPVGTPPAGVSGLQLQFQGLADQANDLNMNWNFLGSSGTPTIGQVNAPSAVSATQQDGYASGQYKSFSIGSDGTVSVTYSNGQKQNVGQLALANVANVQGLE